MEHKCTKEAEISEIYTKVESLDKVINGNGKPGLRDTTVLLTERVNVLIDKIDKADKSKQFNITTLISILAVGIAIIAMFIR